MGWWWVASCPNRGPRGLRFLKRRTPSPTLMQLRRRLDEKPTSERPHPRPYKETERFRQQYPEGRRTGVTLLLHSSEPKMIRNSCSKSTCSERLTSGQSSLNFEVGPDTREGCHYISTLRTHLDLLLVVNRTCSSAFGSSRSSCQGRSFLILRMRYTSRGVLHVSCAMISGHTMRGS